MPAPWRKKLLARTDLDIVPEASTLKPSAEAPAPPPEGPWPRPIVVGAGPAGLFAALRLAREGWKPILVERGEAPEERRAKVSAFWRTGTLDPESNALFGAGGAGLFSDGKLNTRHKDREGLREVLGEFVHAGAPEGVLLDAEPHIGSDLLELVVIRIADTIVRLGGEIRYRTRVSGFGAENGRLRGLHLVHNVGSALLDADWCVLATGHSARDVYETASLAGLALEPKQFAVGLRVEMPQESINASQRGGGPDSRFAAAFRMTRPPLADERACYTFCMCPGGLVIACASEPGKLAVNGMSYYARAGDWGNAAFLVPVLPGDIAGVISRAGDIAPALAGIAFQRHWEKACFAAGLPGGKYAVPASRYVDFMAECMGEIPDRRSVGRAVAADLGALLPSGVVETLRVALPDLIGKLRRVDPNDVLLYGVETRTSSAVRILRSEDGMSMGISGIFPAGEGSGYAGGIMTSALDGWRAAMNLMRSASRTRKG
jgi:uncharacterized FAD-dependent dehydrogenase